MRKCSMCLEVEKIFEMVEVSLYKELRTLQSKHKCLIYLL